MTEHDMKLTVGTVAKYRMTMPNGDTMIALVDDAIGLLVIHEYDGTWGHWWGIDHIGKQTFVEFLRTTACDYLANKLVPYDMQRGVDVEATIVAHQKAAMAAGCGDDEILMDEIESKDWEEVESGASRNPLDEYGIDGEHWNLIHYEDSMRMKTVRDVCLPLLKRALAESSS